MFCCAINFSSFFCYSVSGLYFSLLADRFSMLKGNIHIFLFCVFLLNINDNVIKSNEKEGVHSHVSGYKHINYFYFVCFFRTNVIYCLTL